MTTESLDRSFAAQLSELAGDLDAEWRPEAPEAGLVRWATSKAGVPLVLPDLALDGVPQRRWSEAPVLASVGYRLHALGVENSAADSWLGGFDRLRARDVAPADRNSFLFRPVELLGLAIGADEVVRRVDCPRTWLRQVIETHGPSLGSATVLTAVLSALASRHVGAEWHAPSRLDPKTTVDLAILAWLGLSDQSLFDEVSVVPRVDVERRLLDEAVNAHIGPNGLVEQGLFFIALHQVAGAAVKPVRLDGSRPAATVVELCQRFPLFVAALGQRHANRPPLVFKDEYDVQDVLSGLLRLHFDDVRPEEWNPSYGGVQSRSDLLLKRERVVVETKMTRRGLGQRELVNQLTVDKAQYRTHPDCGTLVCFIYDPAHRVRTPAALEADLSGTDERLTTVVVVSPKGL